MAQPSLSFKIISMDSARHFVALPREYNNKKQNQQRFFHELSNFQFELVAETQSRSNVTF